MAVLRLIKESELRRRDVIGSGAFGTVYKVATLRRACALNRRYYGRPAAMLDEPAILFLCGRLDLSFFGCLISQVALTIVTKLTTRSMVTKIYKIRSQI